ncbi:unnamed protein product, partial [Oikopleura dioica]
PMTKKLDGMKEFPC